MCLHPCWESHKIPSRLEAGRLEAESKWAAGGEPETGSSWPCWFEMPAMGRACPSDKSHLTRAGRPNRVPPSIAQSRQDETANHHISITLCLAHFLCKSDLFSNSLRALLLFFSTLTSTHRPLVHCDFTIEHLYRISKLFHPLLCPTIISTHRDIALRPRQLLY